MNCNYWYFNFGIDPLTYYNNFSVVTWFLLYIFFFVFIIESFIILNTWLKPMVSYSFCKINFFSETSEAVQIPNTVITQSG